MAPDLTYAAYTSRMTWGHPETSGFPTLDYFFSSDLMEPSDAQQRRASRWLASEVSVSVGMGGIDGQYLAIGCLSFRQAAGPMVGTRACSCGPVQGRAECAYIGRALGRGAWHRLAFDSF